MRIFLSAGEPSGDLHGANLIRSLRRLSPEVEFVGYGGPQMAEAGAEVLYPLVELSVMWFLRVLLNLHKFIGLIGKADRYFRDQKPDAVVLIDYPGLHWWIARKAKARSIPVFYFVPPQIWAWAGWRVKKVRKYVDHVLCSLPFEEDWYHARGVPQARYVGHPYFDELAQRILDESFLSAERAKGETIVAILPGSRTQEVERNLPIMLRAATKLAGSRPDLRLRFAVACLHERHKAKVEAMIADAGLSGGLPIEVYAGRTAELIRLASMAWAVSGSVGLELLIEALPTVVLYKVRRFDLLVARHFIKAKYISLVNLLADSEVFPEYLTERDVSRELARWAELWLSDPAERARASSVLADLRDTVAVPGATDRAAREIVEAMRPISYRGPHGRHAAPDVGKRDQGWARRSANDPR
jgi:lipid-A-disaccharide synthase